ncbi:MAG: chlorophyllase/cutinase-like alpha/beta fold protein [bacterium]
MHPFTRLAMPFRIHSLFLAAIAAIAASAAPAHADSSLPGPFPVSQRNVTVTRSNGTTFTAQLRYPATSTAANAPFATGAAPAAAITFGHGFLSSVDLYDSTLDHLASHGYIVIATTSGGELFPNHANYAVDMRQCLTWLEQQDVLAGGFLFGAVNEGAFGVSGHSMGGGASMLAAAADVRIRCAATLAAAETNPSAAAASTSVQFPLRAIVGSADTIVAPSTTVNQYNNCDAPRQFVNIAGASHCGFVDSSFIGCDSISLPRAEQLALTRALLVDFFDAHLRRDADAFATCWIAGAMTGTTMNRDARTSASLANGSLTGPAGTDLFTTLTVVNAGPDSTAIRPRATGTNLAVVFEPVESAPLAAGASAVFSVRVASSTAATAAMRIEAVRVRDGAGVSTSLAVEFTATSNPADLDGDGVVAASDLAVMLGAWGSCKACPADLDHDGQVGASDLAVLLGAWGS